MLDTSFAKPSAFIKLNKKANLAHIRLTYNLPRQAEDKEIYELACRESRFVVTINYKDFKMLVRQGKSGVIGLPAYLSTEEMDILLTDFISEKDPDDFIGKATKI